MSMWFVNIPFSLKINWKPNQKIFFRNQQGDPGQWQCVQQQIQIQQQPHQDVQIHPGHFSTLELIRAISEAGQFLFFMSVHFATYRCDIVFDPSDDSCTFGGRFSPHCHQRCLRWHSKFTTCWGLFYCLWGWAKVWCRKKVILILAIYRHVLG